MLLRNLALDFQRLCGHKSWQEAYVTHHDRLRWAHRTARELEFELNHKGLRARNLTSVHTDELVELWLAYYGSADSVRNRLSVLRYLVNKLGRAKIVAESNADYGIPPRKIKTIQRAWKLTDDLANRVDCRYIRASLWLQYAFGLRRSESLLIRISEAWKGDRLVLRGSWCKGGRPRTVPYLETPEQEYAMNLAEGISQGGALILPGKSFYQQTGRYKSMTYQAELWNCHGLRHSFAQRSYRQLTGFDCPHAGGSDWETLSDEERALDSQARRQVHTWLGHGENRADISKRYLGGIFRK